MSRQTRPLGAHTVERERAAPRREKPNDYRARSLSEHPERHPGLPTEFTTVSCAIMHESGPQWPPFYFSSLGAWSSSPGHPLPRDADALWPYVPVRGGPREWWVHLAYPERAHSARQRGRAVVPPPTPRRCPFRCPSHRPSALYRQQAARVSNVQGAVSGSDCNFWQLKRRAEAAFQAGGTDSNSVGGTTLSPC